MTPRVVPIDQKLQTAPRLPLELDRDSRVPIQRQLTEKLKEAIVGVKLMPGQLLPSSRDLAKMMGISRSTAVRAYDDLVAQGYIETIDGTGTFVRKRLLKAPFAQQPSELPLSSFAQHIIRLKPEILTPRDFPESNYGCSPPEFLPIGQWKQVVLESCRQLEPTSIDYWTDPFGYQPLRQAICKYLSRSRMIDTRAENLVVCASSTYLLNLVAELLIDPGDSVVFPEPGGIYARDTFNTFGADLIPIAVDDEGLDVGQIVQLSRAPKLVYVNTSHHDPTGACLSLVRRKMLIEWAEKNAVIIVEDDYDSEYRYAEAPLPSLRAMSNTDNVIYISDFWRTLFPLVNVSYMVAPARLVPVLEQAWQLINHAFHTHFPIIDQLALTLLLENNDLERHVRRTQAIYANRWRACVHELTKNFGSSIKIARESSSYHVFVQMLFALDAETIASRATEAELPLISARRHYTLAPLPNTFLVPWAHISEQELAAKILAFKELIAHDTA